MQFDSTVPFFNHTDFADFSDGIIKLVPPNKFLPQSIFEVTVFGDSLFVPQEEIEISLGPFSIPSLPPPFKANKTASAPGSVVTPPSNEQIIFQYPTTKIIIRGGN